MPLHACSDALRPWNPTRAWLAGFQWLTLSVALAAPLALATPSVATPTPPASSPPAPATPDLATLAAHAQAGGPEEKLTFARALLANSPAAHSIPRVVGAFEDAAKAGSPAAAVQLGQWYESGENVPQSYATAVNYYRQAEQRGDPLGALRLGLLHFEGAGVPRNRTQGIAYVRSAAERGLADAQRIMSDLYMMGWGVKKNLATALAWAEKAAQADHPEAQRRVGDLLLARARTDTERQRARTWHQLAAEAEYAGAMIGLAQSFLHPQNQTEDQTLAVRWLELAIEAGNHDARFVLAMLCSLLPPQPANAQRSLALLQEGSALHHIESSEVLEYLQSGHSLTEAFRYYFTTSWSDRYLARYQTSRADKLGDPDNREPVPLRLCQPVYPQSLRLEFKEGEALIGFVVDTRGLVLAPFVVKATHPLFGERAIEAVKQWRFSPARKNGRLVNCRMRVPVIFRFSEIPNIKVNASSPPAPPSIRIEPAAK